MIQDLAVGKMPSNWHSVLYALVVKPLPNNPALVCGRREIALMAVDMKACLHMVCSAAYSQVQGRLAPDQLG